MNLFFKKLDFNYIKWHKNLPGSQKDPPWFLEYSEDRGIRGVKCILKIKGLCFTEICTLSR
jgi:hypothetical protein